MSPPRLALTTKARLRERELVGADAAGGLGRLRHVDGDEVRLREQLVEREQRDAELLGAGGGDVGVVGDDVRRRTPQALGDQGADAAEADDADGLLVELDAGVLRALPLPAFAESRGRRDVAGQGQDVADRELGRRDDVRGRRVDDHHAGLGRRLDVDVVETDARAGDDLEQGCRGDRLGVDLRRGADQDRVRVGQRGEQGGAVGAVDVADVEVGAESLDGGGREFFGDQHDRLRHESSP